MSISIDQCYYDQPSLMYQKSSSNFKSSIIDSDNLDNRFVTSNHKSDNKSAEIYHHRRPKHRRKPITRSRAIEKTYVHDVYAKMARLPMALQRKLMALKRPMALIVRDFLSESDSSNFVLDIGCSNGQYMPRYDPNNQVPVFGIDNCEQWFENLGHRKFQRSNNRFLSIADVISIPFRSELFDCIVCTDVLHHLSTADRRIRALKELTRVLCIGGRILITVMGFNSNNIDDIDNHHHRRSQDVLMKLSSTTRISCESSITTNVRKQSNSTIHTLRLPTSESCLSDFTTIDNNNRSSELENCYSFFKKAIKRFSLASTNLYPFRAIVPSAKFNDNDGSAATNTDDNYPIELTNLYDDDDQDLANDTIDYDQDALSYDDEASSDSNESIESVDSALSCSSSIISSNRLVRLSDLKSLSTTTTTTSKTSTTTTTTTSSSSSILMTIKEHLMLWKQYMIDSIEHRQTSTFDIDGDLKDSIPVDETKQADHRCSLPLTGLWRSAVSASVADKSNISTTMAPPAKSKLSKNNKIYTTTDLEVAKIMMMSMIMMDNGDSHNGGDKESIDLRKQIIEQESIGESAVIDSNIRKSNLLNHSNHKSITTNTSAVTIKGQIRKYSLNISHQHHGHGHNHHHHHHDHHHHDHRVHCFKLLAYYSMPELSAIINDTDSKDQRQSSDQNQVCGPSDTGASAVAEGTEGFGDRGPGQEQADVVDDKATDSGAISGQEPQITNSKTLKSPAVMKLQLQQKKLLLRQRSFSADYHQDLTNHSNKLSYQNTESSMISSTQSIPRRFSASPNIEQHRYHNNIPHNQQISIDSEESFVTIIAANSNGHNGCGHSTRNNSDDNNNFTDFDFDDDDVDVDCDYDDCVVEDILMNSNEPPDVYSSSTSSSASTSTTTSSSSSPATSSPSPLLSSSSTDDDDGDHAYYEDIKRSNSNNSMADNDDTSSDHSSLISVLAATVKSASSSTGSARIDQIERDGGNIDTIESVIADESNSICNDSIEQHRLSSIMSLHQYYHLFTRDELLHLVNDNCKNLNIIDLYYLDDLKSWCMVAEKCNVLTI